MKFISKIFLTSSITLFSIIPLISTELTCEDKMLLCGDELHCIPSSQICDYSVDCKDASDEMNFGLCKHLARHKENCPSRQSDTQLKCKSRNDDYYYNANEDEYSFLYNKCLDIVTVCTLGNKCLSPADLSICDEISNNKLKPVVSRSIEETSIASNETENEEESFEFWIRYIAYFLRKSDEQNLKMCPPLFLPFREKCYSFFTPAQITWYEAKLFCESIGGNLSIINDTENYVPVLELLSVFKLIETKITSNFWIGGYLSSDSKIKMKNNTGKWIWTNGMAVQTGPPFWSLSFTDTSNENITQGNSCSSRAKSLMPSSNTGERCIAMLNANSYYFSDEECSNRYSPLCVTDQFE